MTLQVALKDEANAQKFTLAVGSLALFNVMFLVADANLTTKKNLICLLFFQHFGNVAKTLLEKHRDLLDADCSAVNAASAGTRSVPSQLSHDCRTASHIN